MGSSWASHTFLKPFLILFLIFNRPRINFVALSNCERMWGRVRLAARKAQKALECFCEDLDRCLECSETFCKVWKKWKVFCRVCTGMWLWAAVHKWRVNKDSVEQLGQNPTRLKQDPVWEH